MPRPRPSGTASTGQLPIARTRETATGPTGTARIPVIRQAPAGPAAPRPGVRQPEPARPRTEPPVRSRLRTPPPAVPMDAPRYPVVQRAIPQPFSQLRATAPQPFAHLAPEPVLPTPADFAPAPLRTARRRPGRALLSVLAVVGLLTLSALPAFASGALDAPAVGGITTGDGLQTLEVGSDVEGTGVTTDAMSGAMPVAPAPSWVRPVQGHLGDPYGPRPEQPVPGVNLFHRGQDIVAACGREIHAATAGTVTAARYWGTYGNWILVDTGRGVAVGYAHESRMLVGVGQHVRAGQVIGIVGETGAATGCHLHLEVHEHGVAIDPRPFFAAKHISLG